MAWSPQQVTEAYETDGIKINCCFGDFKSWLSQFGLLMAEFKNLTVKNNLNILKILKRQFWWNYASYIKYFNEI